MTLQLLYKVDSYYEKNKEEEVAHFKKACH